MNLDSVKKHYQKKLDQHGHTPQGVDWKDFEAQYVRFRALSRLFDDGTVNDWGCGYGEFSKFVGRHNYTGYDIVPQVAEGWRFVLSDRPTHVADYTIASGLFNVKNDASESEWHKYMIECLRVMNHMSRKGFGFNVLSSWCDRREPRLYYASPFGTLNECLKFTRLIELNHSYSLYDFTILCRKQ